MRSRRLCWLTVVATVLAGSVGGSLAAGVSSSEAIDTLEPAVSDPSRWVIDTSNLGTRQVEITALVEEQAAVITPTWSASDATAKDPGICNVANSRLYVFQHVVRSDCTQSESFFEISVPPAYVEEGRLGVVFCLQGGAEDDYLFNGRRFTMSDFSGNTGEYKRVIVKASEFSEAADNRRGIQRVGFAFTRNGSMVSAPIKIRRLTVALNRARIVPAPAELSVANPASFYEFTYTTPADVDRIKVKVSKETMDITKQLTASGDSLMLIPQWQEGQIPAGHSGNVYMGESLDFPHNFDEFEVQFLVNIPRAYFADGKLDLDLCLQAGESGHYVWSGARRPLAAFADQAGRDVVLTLTPFDFLGGKGKKRNKIEFVGLQINRHGSVVTEPILLKRISIKLSQ